MLITILLFTLFGSWIASMVPNTTMGNFSIFMTMLLGVKFIVKLVMTTEEVMEAVESRKRIVQLIASGTAEFLQGKERWIFINV